MMKNSIVGNDNSAYLLFVPRIAFNLHVVSLAQSSGLGQERTVTCAYS